MCAPAKKDRVRNLQGRPVVKGKQDYCWTWVNKCATAVKLAVLLPRK